MATIPPTSDSGSLPFRIQPGDYPDLRDAESLARDAEIARRQLTLLSPRDPVSRRRIREILTQLQESQDHDTCSDGKDEPVDRVPFDIWEGDETDGALFLVARDQIVVQVQSPGDNLPGALPQGQELPIEGYERITEPLGDLKAALPVPRRTDAFRSISAKKPQDLAADVRLLKTLNIDASLNYIVPLGHIVKGDDFPEPASSLSHEFPPRTMRTPSSATSKPIRVAVIDTGISAEKREDGWLVDVVHGPDDIDQLDIVLPMNRNDWFAGHGTFATGVVQQVAPFCEIYVYRFTMRNGIGTEREVAAALLRAVEQAQQDDVHLVVNMSVGAPAVNGLAPLALQDAVKFVSTHHPEVVMVASAGNDGTSAPMFPAAFPEVVAVGALTADHQPADFSSFGSWVDCSCVGVGVVSTYVEGVVPPEPIPGRDDVEFGRDSFAVWSGTSFSAPQISGAIARLCQMNDCTPVEARNALLSNRTMLTNYGCVIDELLPGTPA